MKSFFTIGHILTYVAGWTVFSLTLILGIALPSQQLRAAEEETSYSPNAAPLTSDKSPDSAFDQIDKSRRLGLLLDYVKKEGPGWVPGLTNKLRSPFHSVEHFLGFGSGDFGDMGASNGVADFLPPFLQPVSTLMQPPSPDQAHALWFTPGYSHKGFLPLRDAMIASVNLRHRMWDDRLQIDMRPFYGQNWLSTDNYWGTEIGLALGGGGAKQPWGKISLRYSNGESSIMEDDSRFDMHAEVRFGEHLGLNAGVRENEDTGLGNYVLLRWNLSGP